MNLIFNYRLEIPRTKWNFKNKQLLMGLLMNKTTRIHVHLSAYFESPYGPYDPG